MAVVDGAMKVLFQTREDKILYVISNSVVNVNQVKSYGL